MVPNVYRLRRHLGFVYFSTYRFFDTFYLVKFLRFPIRGQEFQKAASNWYSAKRWMMAYHTFVAPSPFSESPHPSSWGVFQALPSVTPLEEIPFFVYFYTLFCPPGTPFVLRRTSASTATHSSGQSPRLNVSTQKKSSY